MKTTFLNWKLLRQRNLQAQFCVPVCSDAVANHTLSRRDFLKISGLTSGVAMMGFPGLRDSRIELVGDERRLAVTLDGIERWVIEPARFAGRHRLGIHRAANGDFRFQLAGARFAGTRLSADIACELKNGEILRILFPNNGWQFSMPAVEWLNGQVVAKSKNLRSIEILQPHQIGPPEISVESVELRPGWDFRFTGGNPVGFAFAGNRCAASTLSLTLPASESSLFADANSRGRIGLAHGQKIHFTDSISPGDSELETHAVSFSAQLVSEGLRDDRKTLRNHDLPAFCPLMHQALVHVPSVEVLEPGNKSIISYQETFRDHGFDGLPQFTPADIKLDDTEKFPAIAKKLQGGDDISALILSRLDVDAQDAVANYATLVANPTHLKNIFAKNFHKLIAGDLIYKVPSLPDLPAELRQLADQHPADETLARLNRRFLDWYFSKELRGSRNVGEVFADLVGTRPFNFPADKGGGLAVPNINISSLSRKLGPLAGKAENFCDGVFQPLDFFNKLDKLNARLLGIVELGEILQPINDIRNQVKRIPELLVQKAEGLVSKELLAAENELKRLAAPLQEYLVQMTKKLEDYRDTIERSITAEQKALEGIVGQFNDTWNHFGWLAGDEIGLPPKGKGVSVLDDPCKPYALPNIREQIISKLKKVETVTFAHVQEIQKILNGTCEFKFQYDGKEIQGSLSRLLASLRSIDEQVTRTLADIRPNGILKALKDLQGDLDNISPETMLNVPQHIGALISAFEDEIKLFGNLTSLAETAKRQFESLKTTFVSAAANIEAEAKRLETQIKEALSQMTTEVNKVRDAIEAIHP